MRASMVEKHSDRLSANAGLAPMISKLFEWFASEVFSLLKASKDSIRNNAIARKRTTFKKDKLNE